MDFRSQLSAFQSGSGGDGGGGSRGGRRDNSSSPNHRSRSPNRGYGNSNDRRGYGNDRGGYGNYGHGGGGSDYYGDRRRSRPRNWDRNHHHGPPNARRRQHSPDRDGLGDLRNFGYRIPTGIPPPPTLDEKKRKAKHLVLMAITIDDLPYEHIWKAWCQTLEPLEKDDYYISVVCHAKYPEKVQSEWLRQRLLVRKPKLGRGNSFLDPEFLSRIPSWGSVEITRAMLDLLQNAMRIGHDAQTDMRFAASRYLVRRPTLPLDATEEERIPPVDQFLYISETCLPVATAQEIFGQIQDTTVSWVNARHRKDPETPKNLYENDQFAGIHRRIPGQYRWKADQWVLLCRDHASRILDMDRPHMRPGHQLWQSFRDINASDEMFIPTCLAVLGLLRFTTDGEDTQRSRSINHFDRDKERDRSNNASSGEEAKPAAEPFHFVLKRPVTYTDWTEGMRNPASFTKGLVDFKRVARLARAKGCLVARKFAPFVAVPGAAPEDRKVTGQISVEEWKGEVEVLRQKHAYKEIEKVTEVETKDEAEGEATREEEGRREETKAEKKEEISEGEEEEVKESFLINKASNDTSNNNQANEEEDDDQGENQLE